VLLSDGNWSAVQSVKVARVAVRWRISSCARWSSVRSNKAASPRATS